MSVLNPVTSRLGTIGLYSTEMRFGATDDIINAAHQVEDLGFGAVWLPGAFGGPVFDSVKLILDTTRDLVVATAIANIWAHSADETAQAYAHISAEHPDRFLLGLGASHPEFAEAMGVSDYAKPFTAMKNFLDALDRADPPVPSTGRALAALGPKMRTLAVTRTAGIHSYFVPATHTEATRADAGPDALLAVEHAVVIEDDPARAREIARAYTSVYLGLRHYTQNLLRFGYTEDDFRDGGSDRLVDSLVAWGSPEDIRRRLTEHLDAGATHVCAQIIAAGWDPRKLLAGQDVRQPTSEWLALADAVLPARRRECRVPGRPTRTRSARRLPRRRAKRRSRYLIALGSSARRIFRYTALPVT